MPLPELGGRLKERAEAVQTMIRAQTPPELRSSIRVTPYEKGGKTGLAIEYDDRAENFVYIAMEYPRDGGKE